MANNFLQPPKMKNFISIVDDAVQDSKLLDTFYKKSLEKEGLESFLSLRDLGLEANKLKKRLIDELWINGDNPFYKKDKCLFFEIWSNFYHDSCTHQSVKGLPYHLDKDEIFYNHTGEIKSPVYASLIYLGPKQQISGGDLYINTKGISHYLDYEQNGPKTINLNSPEWVKIEFKYNRFIIFDARLPHLVSPVITSPSGSPRSALAINVWDKEIAG